MRSGLVKGIVDLLIEEGWTHSPLDQRWYPPELRTQGPIKSLADTQITEIEFVIKRKK